MHRQQRPVSTTISKAASSVLSNREIEVLRLVATGLSDIQVATQLSLSRHTVHAHAKRIYHAVGVHSRAELLATAWAGSPAIPPRRKPLTG